MSIISWNYWGLGNLSAVPALRDLVRTYHHDTVFLCETLVHSSRFVDIKNSLGFDFCFLVDCVGQGGGLVLLWTKPFDCNLINFSQNFINVSVHEASSPVWRLTGYYGYLERQRRRESWNLLRYLVADTSLPWCIFADFNDHPTWLLRGFRETIINCNLHDLPMEGHQYTWARRRGKHDFMEDKHVRGLATMNWIYIFPNFKLTNGILAKSDHSPILIYLNNALRRKTQKIQIWEFLDSRTRIGKNCSK